MQTTHSHFSIVLVATLVSVSLAVGCRKVELLPEVSDSSSDTETDTGLEDCLVDAPDAMVLDIVTAISAPVQNVETVTFENAEPVTLDVSTPTGPVWHDMLQLSIDYGEPVYLRIDPGARLIRDVLRSFDGKVVSLHEEIEYVGAEFTTSAAIHTLYRDNTCFDHITAELESALADQSNVQVSESDEDGIVDVRPPL